MIKVFLPQDVIRCVGTDAAAVTNRSLRFAKFPAMSDSREDKEWRKGLLEQILKIAADGVGLRVRPVTPPGATVFTLCLRADMVVDHAVGVIENSGLALDRHFGHPYIPGSALKGIAQVGAALCGATTRECQLVFGWAPRNGDETLPEDAPKAFAGSVIFFAAHPAREAPLRVDIVNCHHMKYYQSGGSRSPTDDESPNPQFFWVVKAGAEFQFVLAPVTSDRVAAMRERLGLPANFDPLAKAKEWLIRGLTEHGVGAKTAAGYGWFKLGGTQAVSHDASSVIGKGAAHPKEEVPLTPAEKLIAKWQGKLRERGNFAVALPELAALEDDATLKKVFEAVIPQEERARNRKNNPYWQSFTSGRHGDHGKRILERVGFTLR